MTDLPKAHPELLAVRLEAAKANEAEARQARIAIEEQLIEVLGAKTEGSESHDVGEYKVTITGKLTRSLDADVWEEIADQVPRQMHPTRTKVELDLKKLRALEKELPDVFRVVAPAITTKPAKTAVTIKRKDS